MQLSDKTYERLTPDERFRISVEAFARLDIAEIDRLQDTCGYVSIREHAPAYFARLRGFWELSMFHGIRARDGTVGFALALGKLCKSTDQMEDEDIDLLIGWTAGLKGLNGAWEEFCKELGVDPTNTDLSYYTQAKKIVASIDEFIPDEIIEPNTEMQSEWLETLRDMWRHRLDRIKPIEAIEIAALAKTGK
jgi:hypothetical protein